jgi:hypothetical protein
MLAVLRLLRISRGMTWRGHRRIPATIGDLSPYQVTVEPGVYMLPALDEAEYPVVRALQTTNVAACGREAATVYGHGTFDAGGLCPQRAYSDVRGKRRSMAYRRRFRADLGSSNGGGCISTPDLERAWLVPGRRQVEGDRWAFGGTSV